MEAYLEQYGSKAIPMFAIEAKGKMNVFVAEGEMKPKSGWTILSLVPADDQATEPA